MLAQIGTDRPKWGPPPVTDRTQIFAIPKPLPGTVPPDFAFDSVGLSPAAMAYAAYGQYGEGISFPGYPYLAELTQRAEYRRGSEIIAKEMTRKWIKLKAVGKDDKSERIKALEDAMDRYKVQDLFRRAAEHDGFFGIGHLYVDTGASDDPEELKTGLWLDKAKIAKGSLRGFHVIDPIWTYPNLYNSNDPLKADFYRPKTWFVMAKEVHRTRLLTFISREVPDLLKPAYLFGGLSLSQLGMPYVQNWLETRQSVNALIQSFSTPILGTTLDTLCQPGSLSALVSRLAMFNLTRNNRGIFAVDKATEEFSNVTTPLTTLDQLQAQAQEHMASCWKIPLVVLLGITPSGLNASTDGEIRTFYDWIHSSQCALFDEPLRRVMDIIQLSEFGDIDPEITHEWEPLWQLDEAGKAAVQKTKADTHAVLIENSIVTPEEARQAEAADVDSPYHGLEGPAPEPLDLGEEDAGTSGGELSAEPKSKERDGV